jgi:hypothetical protein
MERQKHRVKMGVMGLVFMGPLIVTLAFPDILGPMVVDSLNPTEPPDASGFSIYRSLPVRFAEKDCQPLIA